MSRRRKRKIKFAPKRIGRSLRRAQRRKVPSWAIPFSLVLLLVAIVMFGIGFVRG
ncbi:MAG: hypothetical protein V4719_09140 [Planctomycetota bacterium]